MSNANINKMKRILVPQGMRKKIMTELGVSYDSVKLALLGVRDTDKARQIRAKALELGGIELKKN